MNKVQITLTPQESELLGARADQLGYNVTRFIKLLIGKEVLSLIEEYPTIRLSEKAINKIKKAHEEHEKGKTVPLKDIDDLDQL